MPPEYLALIDKPLLLAVLLVPTLFIGIWVGMGLERTDAEERRAAWKARKIARGEWVDRKRQSFSGNFPGGPVQPLSRMPDPADQLRIVMASKFQPRRFLNRGESRVFAALEPILTELAPGWRVMAQVSLGEVLESDSVEGFNTINAKRVDFLLLDAQMRPRHAIEYQGQGHHQGPATARDPGKNCGAQTIRGMVEHRNGAASRGHRLCRGGRWRDEPRRAATGG